MVLFEITAINAMKPILIAGMGMCLMEKIGFDLSKIPVVGGFIGDADAEESELGARYFCCFGRRRRQKLEGDEEEKQSGMGYIVPVAMTAIGAIDIIMGGILLESMYLPVDQPLKQWLFGGLMLSYPTSCLVYNTAKIIGFKHAFLLESAANFVSFGWLSWGMLLISKSTAYKTAPLLFWSIYVTCVTSWSVIGTSMLGLILTTVVAILFGNKTSPIG